MFFDYFTKYYINHDFGPSYILTIIIMVLEVVLAFNDYRVSFKRKKGEPKGFINRVCSFFLRESKEDGIANWKSILYFLADLVVTYIVQILLFCAAEFFFGSHNYINYIVWPIMVAAHAFFMNRFSWFERIAKGGVLITVLLLEPVLSQIIGAPFGQLSGTYFHYIAVLVFFAVGSFTIWMLRKCSMGDFSFSNPVCLILIAFVTVWSFILIVFMKIEPNAVGDYSFDYVHFLLFFGLLAFSEVTYYLYYETLLEHDRALRNQATALKAENDKEMLEFSMNNMESLRKLRHDIKNQYQYMKVLFDSGDKEKLKTFLFRYVRSCFCAFVFCGYRQ